MGGFLSLYGSYVGAGIVLALPSLITAVAGDTQTQAAAGLQLLIFGMLLIGVIIMQSNGGGQQLKDAVRRAFRPGERPKAGRA